MLRHILHTDVDPVFNRIFDAILALTLFFIAGLLGFQAADTRLPVRATDLEVVTPVVPANGGLTLSAKITIDKQCETHTDRWMIDSTGKQFNLDSIDYAVGGAPVGLLREFTVTIPLPPGMAEGPAIYRTVSVYRCNLIQQFWPLVGPFIEMKFAVGPADPALGLQLTPEQVQQLSGGLGNIIIEPK